MSATLLAAGTLKERCLMDFGFFCLLGKSVSVRSMLGITDTAKAMEGELETEEGMDNLHFPPDNAIGSLRCLRP